MRKSNQVDTVTENQDLKQGMLNLATDSDKTTNRKEVDVDSLLANGAGRVPSPY